MKRHLKCIFAVLMAFALGITATGGLMPAASAEEIDPYVFTQNTAVNGYDCGSLPCMYTSPFRMFHACYDPAREHSCIGEIFQLVNTTRLTAGGNGAYASIPVYCTAPDADTESTVNYRRIDLEDSRWNASEAARLRSVILHSFPYIQDVAAITEAANVWLNANGEKTIQELQIGEAMLATQQAIWTITLGDAYTIREHYTGCGAYDSSRAVYQSNAAETETANTESNILGLYKYLVNLSGTTPLDDVISEFSFEKVMYSTVKAVDGTDTVTVSCTVNTVVGAGDALTLSAACGEAVQFVALTSGGDYSFTFEGLSDQLAVKLEINGYQTGGDVYLFDPAGGPVASQSMIGYDDSRLPVHGETVASPDRVLNIYKTAGGAAEVPLADIEFELYRADSIAQKYIARYKRSGAIAVLKTDVRGFASYNFSENGMPDGVYMVVERDSAAAPAEPFFITVPGTTEDGNGQICTITVHSRSAAGQEPDIQMDVVEIGNDHATCDAEEPHVWIIRGSVPDDIADAAKYVISDTIDYRLTYRKGSPIVRLYTSSGEELDLPPGTHYKLAEGTTVVDGRIVDCFSISLTERGMAYVAENLGSGEAIPEIRVYFKAVINSGVSPGVAIPNQAHLDYTDFAGIEHSSNSDVPEVHTADTCIPKTTWTENVLVLPQDQLPLAKPENDASFVRLPSIKKKRTRTAHFP